MGAQICIDRSGCIFVAGFAMADRVEFKNGDILTGKIIEYDGKKLTLKTDVAGNIQIDLKDVKTLVLTTGRTGPEERPDAEAEARPRERKAHRREKPRRAARRVFVGFRSRTLNPPPINGPAA